MESLVPAILTLGHVEQVRSIKTCYTSAHVVIVSILLSSVTTKKVIIEDNTYRNGVPGVASTTPSVSSFRSSATGRSRGTGGTRSRYGSEKGSNSGHPNSMDKTGQIMELDDDPDADFGNLSSTGALFDMLQKTVRQYDLSTSLLPS